MSNVSVSKSWVDDMQRERQEMLRKLETQAEQLRQKDAIILVLAGVLDLMKRNHVTLLAEEREAIDAALLLARRKP